MTSPRIQRASACTVTRHALRTQYRRVYPNVWVRRDLDPNPLLKAEAAWAWAGGGVVLGGYSAAAVHGARYLPSGADAVVLSTTHRRATPGIDLRRHRLAPNDVCVRRHMAVTTPQRTAVDLCSWLDVSAAVETVDALYQATGLDRTAMDSYLGDRPSVRVRRVLALTDEGAESIWETRTRLFLIRGGLPRPSSQVTVFDREGRRIGRFDLVFENEKVIVEYDGDQHFESAQRNRDVVRWNALVDAGWTLIRVKASQLLNHPEVVLGQVRRALLL